MQSMLAGTLAVLSALAAPATAQDLTREYGIDLVTIRAPGNRDANLQETPSFEFMPSGSVAYEYRIGRTELTTSQWLEFVRAYGPHWAAQGRDPRDFGLTGDWIDYTPPPGQPPSAPGGTYSLVAGTEQWPTDMGWRFAARYCNWLHNGKANTPEAFESGAYDASTFTENPDGSLNDQISRSPGARFWIPSVDEYVKGMNYDPDRYGPGLEGYWSYPDGSNEILISGLPEDGGETTGGISGLPGYPVAQYPWVQSPWGLLDGSGGVSNWTDGLPFPDDPSRSRLFFGSRTASPAYYISDLIDLPGYIGPPAPIAGLRIAAAVPSGAGSTLVLFPLLRLSRRRR